MTARPASKSPFDVLLDLALVPVAVHHAPALSGLLTGLSVQVTHFLDHALSDPAGADVRWIEGYNSWCRRWAAAQTRPELPIG